MGRANYIVAVLVVCLLLLHDSTSAISIRDRSVAQRTAPYRGLAISNSRSTSNSTTGPTNSTTGPTNSTTGPTNSTTSPSNSTTGPTNSTTGPTNSTTGPTNSTTGPTNSTTGPSNSTTGPTNSTTGPSNSTTGPTNSTTGPTNSTAGPQQIANGKIIMDYIGANGKNVYLKDIPVNDSIAFNFILSFAIDSDRDGNSQNGVFDAYWQSTLTPDAVATLKSQHPNVRVLLSLTGWSIYTNAGQEKVVYWYDPKNEEEWLQNGVNSLTKLVQTYHLDGIDVDYEKVPDNSRFVPVVGELLTRLKASGVIKIATLAPYTATNQVYSLLFKNFTSVIDYVNYQFFTEIVANSSDFVGRYNNLATYSYSYEKLIPGYQVNGIGLQGQNFTDAALMIKNSTNGLNGIMIYSADDGLTNNWYYEKEFQALLLQ